MKNFFVDLFSASRAVLKNKINFTGFLATSAVLFLFISQLKKYWGYAKYAE